MGGLFYTFYMNCFGLLPVDLQLKILSCLSPSALLSVASTNRNFNNLCWDPSLWQDLRITVAPKLPVVMAKRMQMLRRLDMSPCIKQTVKDRHVQPFVKCCPRLRSISLTASSVTDAILEDLDSVISLEELRIQGSHVTDSGIVHLHRFHLKVLDVSHCLGITDHGFAELLRAIGSHLEYLGIDNCTGLTPLCCRAIASQCPNLTGLIMDGENVTDFDICPVLQSVPNLTIFESANLRNGVNVLGGELSKPPPVKTSQGPQPARSWGDARLGRRVSKSRSTQLWRDVIG
eukprot:c15381_g1_i2.p1 GENE.c15381_g1_i2~~c15381_g1_i2.p1  ORF type:complete len:289 (+),score=40.30 c15381_g1_i2:3-869(+)